MTETVSWIDPNNVEHPLNVEGSLGRFVPPAQLFEIPIAVGNGSTITNARYTSRPLEFDIYIVGDTVDEIRAQERELAVWFDTTNRGPGIVRNYANDGTVREIRAYYQSGLEGDDTPGSRASSNHRRYQLQMRCPIGIWENTQTLSVSWPIGVETTEFFPIFPLRLGASSVIGSVTLSPTNGLDSEVPVWPIWVIDGPGTDIALTNSNTNESIIWSGTLSGGDQLIIDTTEARKSVLLNGENAFASLRSYGFWQLRPGTNDLTVSMDGTDTNSRIAIYWRNAFLTP